MRRLIYIPIIHTEADMGSLAGTLKEQFTQRFGSENWNARAKTIETIWKTIEAAVNALRISFKKTKIYQDGLPVCGKELDIIRQLAKQGSKNHQIIDRMLVKGARVVGTEDPGLLLEEYKFIQETIKGKLTRWPFLSQWFLRRKGKRLLLQRDQFIARRIDETLKKGDIGIIFIGLVHRVFEHLPKDIKIEFLNHQVPFENLASTLSVKGPG